MERAKADLASALVAVLQLDPAGVATPDLRGCLLMQIEAHQREMICDRQNSASHRTVFELAHRIVDKHLMMLQKRDLRELAKAVGKPVEEVQQATEFVRTLDPRPAQRYNRSEAQLIEPDVAFVKRDDECVVAMDEEGLPALRVNQSYRKLITQNGTEKDVKEYVKERYRSAIQLLRNSSHTNCDVALSGYDWNVAGRRNPSVLFQMGSLARRRQGLNL